MSEAEPSSPCTGVCTIDATRLCQGCLRTLDEIAAWPSASSAQKRAILGDAAKRMLAASARPA